MKKIRRFCLTLDLKNDADLIAAYEEHHKAVWPEVLQSISNAGILEMEIYRFANRLFMVMEVSEEFSFEAKEAADKNNAKVQAWEMLMWKYQQSLPGALPGEKWQLMKPLFSLSTQNKE